MGKLKRKEWKRYIPDPSEDKKRQRKGAQYVNIDWAYGRNSYNYCRCYTLIWKRRE